MLDRISSARPTIFSEGSSFETCTQKLRELVDKIKEIFLKVLQTIFPCFFKAPESIDSSRVTASVSTTTEVTSATEQVLSTQTQQQTEEQRAAEQLRQQQAQQAEEQRLQRQQEQLEEVRRAAEQLEQQAQQEEAQRAAEQQAQQEEELRAAEQLRQQLAAGQPREERVEAGSSDVTGTRSLVDIRASVYVAMKALESWAFQGWPSTDFNQDSLDECLEKGAELYEKNRGKARFDVLREEYPEITIDEVVSKKSMPELTDELDGKMRGQSVIVCNQLKNKAYVIAVAPKEGDGPRPCYLLSVNADPISLRRFEDISELKEAAFREEGTFSAYEIIRKEQDRTASIDGSEQEIKEESKGDVAKVTGSEFLEEPKASIYVALKALEKLSFLGRPSIGVFNQQSLDTCLSEGLGLYWENPHQGHLEGIRNFLNNNYIGLEFKFEDVVLEKSMSVLINVLNKEITAQSVIVYNQEKTKAYVISTISKHDDQSRPCYLFSANADPISFCRFEDINGLKEFLRGEKGKFSALKIELQ